MDPEPDFGGDSYKGSEKLKGKVALVTGSDSGIGKAIALAFAREGADVAIAYWKEHEDAEGTAKLIEEAGVKHILLPGDLVDEAVCQEWIDKTISQLGKIDILVNNASTQEESLESFTHIKRDRLERTFKVNIIGMFSLAQKAVTHMLERGQGGNIINIASIQAYKPSPPILDYSCTKGAIVTLTKGIALEVAEKGIRCNCIAPGPVWTPLVVSSFPTEKTTKLGEGQCPLNRVAQPKEFMATAVYLADDNQSSYVTGAIMNLTGGNPHIG
jgi:hypothetical protein